MIRGFLVVIFIWGSHFAESRVEDVIKTQNIYPGDDPHFTIVAHEDRDFKATNRKVMVFDIPIYAFADVEDKKLLHAANIMAQYLDNDEDGFVDNPLLVDALTGHGAALFLWQTTAQLDMLEGAYLQDLGAAEIHPEWHTRGHRGEFDASIEKILHIISHAGYANAYPGAFSEKEGSLLTNAMDSARGGRFVSIPPSYPEAAWFTRRDKRCDYSCMAAEYFYWAFSSILGAQDDRREAIRHEWLLGANDLVQEYDRNIFHLLTDIQYTLPVVLPDGRYRK